ncbi:MAG: CaiB/BaiF CoA-transferase family protein [Peptoniphilus sp.]|nr:CaiB/BaiF CoA-transferase family protein [Peptoniphilus sp.]
MKKILDGVKVVEFATFVAAPIASKLLAEWGAEVIKVENYSRDPMRKVGALAKLPTEDNKNPGFDNMNGFKKSISINLKDEEGIKVLKDLIKDADIFITNYRKGALSKMTLTYEDLLKVNEKIIYASVSGYGETGPEEYKQGYDITSYYARGGVSGTLNDIDSYPLNTVQAFGDFQVGTYLISGILAALYKKHTKGEGEYLNVSIYNTAIFNLGYPIMASQFGFKYPISRFKNPNPLQGSYRTKDNRWIQFAIAIYDRDFPKVCEVIGREDLIEVESLAKFENIVKDPEKLVRILDQEIPKKDADTWVKEMNARDIPCEKLVHWDEILLDEQAFASDCIGKIDYGDEEVKFIKSPVKFKTLGKYDVKRGPLYGEHTEEILKDINYTEEEINQLKNKDIIRGNV